ncbi:MAG: DNA integrity scanning protein DisA nucleotide-binding domain protein [Bacilli bacterium]
MGALIVVERDDSLANYINNAQRIYAEVTNPLLTAVFFVNNPLHDGGVIIQGDQIACANAVFPN